MPSKRGPWSIREPFAILELRICGAIWARNIELMAMIASSSENKLLRPNLIESMRRLDDMP